MDRETFLMVKHLVLMGVQSLSSCGSYCRVQAYS